MAGLRVRSVHAVRRQGRDHRLLREGRLIAGVRTARAPGTEAPTARFWLVRHAETEWSRTGRHTGRTDVPLTRAGVASLASLRDRLSTVDFCRVLTSPLQRARHTCELLGRDEAEVVGGLVEWDYGQFEGLTHDEITQRRPDWDLWRDGAPDGESPHDVERRIDEVVDRLRSIEEGEVLVVAHGHALRSLAARWIGLPVAAGGRLRLSTGAVCQLGWHRGHSVIQRWNAV